MRLAKINLKKASERRVYSPLDRKTRIVSVAPRMGGRSLQLLMALEKSHRSFRRGRRIPLVWDETRAPGLARKYLITELQLTRETAIAMRDTLDEVLRATLPPLEG